MYSVLEEIKFGIRPVDFFINCNEIFLIFSSNFGFHLKIYYLGAHNLLTAYIKSTNQRTSFTITFQYISTVN